MKPQVRLPGRPGPNSQRRFYKGNQNYLHDLAPKKQIFFILAKWKHFLKEFVIFVKSVETH